MKLLPELLKPHDLLTHLACNPWRVLLFFDLAENVEIVVVQSQKTGMLRVLFIGLVRLPMNNDKLLPCKDSVHISVNSCPDSILGILRVLSFRVHEVGLSSELEAETISVPDLVTLPFHEPEEVSNRVSVLNRCFEVGLQHGAVGGLAFTLAKPFDIAHRFLAIAVYNHRQAVLPAQSVRHCTDLLEIL